MKTFLHVLLWAIAYLLMFILGSCTGLIHPACYAYVGALLPLISAFIYLYTCKEIKGFGAATVLNGFVLVLLLIAGEADMYVDSTVVMIPAILAMRLAERALA